MYTKLDKQRPQIASCQFTSDFAKNECATNLC